MAVMVFDHMDYTRADNPPRMGAGVELNDDGVNVGLFADVLLENGYWVRIDKKSSTDASKTVVWFGYERG